MRPAVRRLARGPRAGGRDRDGGAGRDDHRDGAGRAPDAPPPPSSRPGPADVRQLYLLGLRRLPRRRGAGDEPGADAGRRRAGVARLPADDRAHADRPGGPGGGAGPPPPAAAQPGPGRARPSRSSATGRPTRPQTIAALVDYVHQLTGGGGPDIPLLDEGDLAEGGSLFRLQCAACHAWAGDGGALLHVDAPSLHASTPTQIAEAIRLGPGQMPAFGEAALTDEQLSSVVAYVRHLDDARDRGGRPLWHLGPVAEGGLALLALAGLMVFLRWIGERG